MVVIAMPGDGFTIRRLTLRADRWADGSPTRRSPLAAGMVSPLAV